MYMFYNLFYFIFIVNSLNRLNIVNYRSSKCNRICINNKLNADNFFINSYKKTTEHSKFLKSMKISQIFNRSSNIVLYNFSKYYPTYRYGNIYVDSFNFYNEVLFLLNKKVKIYIHIEQIFLKTNIYHIGITFRSLTSKVRYDIQGINLGNLRVYDDNAYKKTIMWDYTNKTLDEIIDYENSLNFLYIVGIYDCRHYVRNLTTWASNKPTPVWNLYKLI